jgi:hypothetical protein
VAHVFILTLCLSLLTMYRSALATEANLQVIKLRVHAEQHWSAVSCQADVLALACLSVFGKPSLNHANFKSSPLPPR